MLTGAAVVRIRPLRPAELAGYLPRTARPEVTGGRTITKWEPVLARMRDRPRDPEVRVLSQALSTPLMTTLARAAYSDTDKDPAALLDQRRFPDRQAIEDHLLDQFIPAVYDESLVSAASDRRWVGDSARRWLVFLARHADSLSTRELAWWQLAGAVPWVIRGWGAGPAVGLSIALMQGVGYARPVSVYFQFTLPLLVLLVAMAVLPFIAAGVALVVACANGVEGDGGECGEEDRGDEGADTGRCPVRRCGGLAGQRLGDWRCGAAVSLMGVRTFRWPWGARRDVRAAGGAVPRTGGPRPSTGRS
ncbi:hypothetical protein AB0C96_41525 [Streptomyces sp. NPDC048506]|uniref:hypothetical protein n=1 Tax=Streptomyces sp. NPDC048506 TaxID=3155028 RepID=UPI003443E671